MQWVRTIPSGAMLGLALASAAGIASCGSPSTIPCPEPTGTYVNFDPTLTKVNDASEAQNWLTYPFPAEHRRKANGTIDMDDFPKPSPGGGTVSLFTDYVSAKIDGFGTNSPVYLMFTAPLDPTSLPDDPAAFSATNAPVQLINISPGSPEYGSRRPLRWELFTVDGEFVPPNTLAVASAWGQPLRQNTTYALIMTDAIRDATGASLTAPPLVSLLVGQADTACVPSRPSADLFADLQRQFSPLQTLLAAEQFDGGTIVAATVFTTQTITAELAAIYADVQSLPAPSVIDTGWQELGGAGVYWNSDSYSWTAGDTVDYWVMEGRFDSPNYQVGELPYTSERNGGHFNFDTITGEPTPDHFERLRFVLTIPKDPPTDGPCYPIVEYAHGTTGSAWGYAYPQGGRHAARGLASIGIDQPLHGTRWSGSSNPIKVELYSFNFLNPAAARTMFRQSAIDTFSLTRFIRESLRVPAAQSPTGAEICFDGDRIGFFGHSHGGISGAIAAAFEGGIDNWVLSGAGGGLSITMVESNEAFGSIRETLNSLLAPAPGEVFTEMHPVIGLIQILTEITDPINYAPFWLNLADHSPKTSVLVTSAQLDTSTPHRTATAMAIAGRLPVLAPVVIPVPGFELAGLPTLDAPVSGNVDGRTVGFMQWADDNAGPNWSSHFVVFYRPEAINATMRFLETGAFDGTPVLERDPNSNAR